MNRHISFYFIFTYFLFHNLHNDKTTSVNAISSKPLIQDDDKILIIGDQSLLFDGDSESIGFLSLIQKEINNHYYNITFETISDSSDNNNDDLYLQLNQHLANPYNHPNISIILYGTESIHTEKVLSTHYYEYYYDKLIALLNSTDTSRFILISTPLLSGERHDNHNKHDLVFEEITGICQTLIKQKYSLKSNNRINYNDNNDINDNHRPTMVSLLDIRHKMLKYIEHNNIENLDHSCLTYDGYHFNPIGHKFLANEILASLGFDVMNNNNNGLNITAYNPMLENWIDVLLQIGASTNTATAAVNTKGNNYNDNISSNVDKDFIDASLKTHTHTAVTAITTTTADTVNDNDNPNDSNIVDALSTSNSLLSSSSSHADEIPSSSRSNSNPDVPSTSVLAEAITSHTVVNSVICDNYNILGSCLTAGGKKQIFYRSLLHKSQHELNHINPHTSKLIVPSDGS